MSRLADVLARAQERFIAAASRNPLSKGLDALGERRGVEAYRPAGPAPELERPILLVPGQFTHFGEDSWQGFANRAAANPSNGPVAVYVAADHQFHAGSVDGPVMTPSDPRTVAGIEFSNPSAPPSQKEAELLEAATRLREATGEAATVIPHSSGGEVTRGVLDRPESEGLFHDAVFVGPVNHGSVTGNGAQLIGTPLEALGVPVQLKEVGQELSLGSDRIAELNQNWDRQLSRLPGGATIVGVTGAPSIYNRGIGSGDGFVAQQSLALPGAEVVTVRGADVTPAAHLRETSYPGVWTAIDRALTGAKE